VRAIGLVALLAALATAAYLYQQNLRRSAATIGAESPRQMKQAMEDLERGLETQAKDRGRQLEEQMAGQNQ